MPAPLPPLNRVPGSGKGTSDDYHILELVGEGSFGKVYKARRKFTGAITAMKFIAKHSLEQKSAFEAHAKQAAASISTRKQAVAAVETRTAL